MPRRLLEISATVVRERHRFGDCEPYTVVMDAALCNGSTPQDAEGQPSRIVLKGKTEGGERGDDGRELSPEEPAEHLSYRFYGHWQDYTIKGGPNAGQVERQFHFDTFVRVAPYSRAGVVKYLAHAPHIGRVLAGKLFDKFGSDAVKVLREKPDVAAAEVGRLSPAAASEAAAWLDREKALESCTIELVDLLEGRGFPKKLAKDVVKEFGNRAAQVIKEHPYILMRFRGCGFRRCDALYLELGHPPQKLKRQALCAWHHVASNSDGDTWHYDQTIAKGLAGAIAGADVRVEAAIQLATRGGLLAVERTEGIGGPLAWDGNVRWVAQATKARNEERLAAFVVEALGEV